MPKQPRVYCYPDDDTRKRIQDAAARSKLSVSRWLIQASLEKLKKEATR